jgi:hypothetical protein
MPEPADADKIKLASEAYIYGYPLVYNLDELVKFPQGASTILAGETIPYNQFGLARDLLTPDAKFVTPNNDTLYMVVAADMDNGPLVLNVPDTHDRYYGLQFIDAWSNNFAYVGRRPTGTEAGTFLLTPRGYDGPVPAGASVIEAPSRVFVILGRLQVDGGADLPAAHALQDQFILSPLDPSDAPVVGIPAPAAGVADDLLFWEKFRVALAAFPPPAADGDFVKDAAELGLTDAESPFVKPDSDLHDVLVEGEKQAKALLEELSRTLIKMVDGWATARHAFDYNLDRCGPGTIDTAEWKIDDRKIAYVTRAVAARMGLWGNHGYEADYEILWQDGNGEFFDGSHAYELTMSPPPPVDAFWSLTMYDEPDYYLVANPIDRYSIGDRTPGLVYAEDGSVTIQMQHDSPGADKESNWLPAPEGRFRPVLRAYQPGTAILDGTYKFPKVTRTA